ncbi:ribosome recycling factor [Dethiosulfatarculus sandiegensis]|uniref:Ribosome-recycling factor n=1 Tax=Dethiosulfatarculus sandiegensis TaxID=1429043 RepID=A0A0D2J1H6_9BACT|nr:ribosome recycling factor [Dethiosulfatarculus sandiegensis]KIX12049.1 ribosome recycling factor [Dethiosulfatarculus sandiegensis]
MIEETKQDAQKAMQASIEALKRDFKRVRTGRATPALLDGIRADYFGVPTPLNQMASISVPEPRQIVIQPWDPSTCGAIEKAILKSDLGLTPSNDGKLVRITVPPLTEERRKELVKVVRKMGEDTKVAVRNARRDANDLLKEYKKEGEISEDDAFRGQDQIQKVTDEFVTKVDELVEGKEKEIMEF